MLLFAYAAQICRIAPPSSPRQSGLVRWWAEKQFPAMRLVKRERAIAAFFVFLLGEYSVVFFLLNQLVEDSVFVPAKVFLS